MRASVVLLLFAACADPPPPARPVVAGPTTAPVTVASSPPRAEPEAAPPPARSVDAGACNDDVPQQSCVPGPDAVNWGCRSDCASTCSTCARECTDDACTTTCLRTRDRCASGCVKEVEAYYEEVRSNYGCKSKATALQICERTSKCMNACPADKLDACQSACRQKHAAGCNEHFLSLAFGDCFYFQPN